MKKEKFEIIVIGGGPAGIISAVTSRIYYPKSKILLIKDIEKGVIPCGIPYMFSTLSKPEDNSMGNAPLEKNNIDFIVDEVTFINKNKNLIKTKNNNEIGYEKLIIATGSSPIKPHINGIDKRNVFFVKKELNYLKNIKRQIKKSKDIVIVGGGFIGIEFADELSKIKGLNIHLIELNPHLFDNSFDEEFSKEVEIKLIEKGIKIYTKTKLLEIKGDENVKRVLLSNDEEIPADLVIFGIGSKANMELAEKSKIKISKLGICVDKFLRTSDKNIFAIGDCTEKENFITRSKENIMLASTATTQARIVGFNLFNKEKNKDYGTLASYSTKIGDICMASTGITEKTAKANKIDIIIGFAESFDKHPVKLPNSNRIKVKLIFSKKSEEIIGGQILGGDSIGEMINVISTAIQKRFKIHEIEALQIATHPKLTSAPTTYPIINAAQNAIQKLKNEK